MAVVTAWRLDDTLGEPNALAQRAGFCPVFDHDHAGWTSILSRYVRHGWVDYGALQKSALPQLTGYLRSLESVCMDDFQTWTREQRLAFWINAYNAYTVKLILAYYPIPSIRSIGILPGAAFRKRFIGLGALHGRRGELSLNDLEHEILRGEFREPRIHFAIVCASKSCPILRSEAYRARDLDHQLDEAARSFIRDPAKNYFDQATNTLYLSSIFSWFRSDFEQVAGTLPAFVEQYADDDTAHALRNSTVRVAFLDYDWSLNGR